MDLEEKLEDDYFKDWGDDSWANYVGWYKDFENYTVLASRTYTLNHGIYDISQYDRNSRLIGIRSHTTQNYQSIQSIRGISIDKIRSFIRELQLNELLSI